MVTQKVAKKICSNTNCSKKGKEQLLNNFYSTTSPFFEDEKLHVCKSCCSEIIERDGFDGFQSLMKLINKPIYSDLFKGDYGEYIKIVNSMPQYRKNIYEDSTLFEEKKSVALSNKVKLIPTELEEEELLDLQFIFGEGYDEKDYIFLRNEFDDWSGRYDVETKALEELIVEICLTKLDIRKKRANGEKVDTQLKTLQDLLGSSNLKPSQETGANSVEQETFGTLIKKWENERPLPKPDPEWEDVNGIRRLIIWFVGHMANMSGNKNPYQEEYERESEKYEVYNKAMEEDDK